MSGIASVATLLWGVWILIEHSIGVTPHATLKKIMLNIFHPCSIAIVLIVIVMYACTVSVPHTLVVECIPMYICQLHINKECY